MNEEPRVSMAAPSTTTAAVNNAPSDRRGGGTGRSTPDPEADSGDRAKPRYRRPGRGRGHGHGVGHGHGTSHGHGSSHNHGSSRGHGPGPGHGRDGDRDADGGRPRSRRQRLPSSTSSAAETCLVCHDDLVISAIGQCDHPICYKCSSAMRLLCEQMYCAICRADMPKVVFLKELRPFRSIDTSSFLVFKKSQIYFESSSVQGSFFGLIEHKCKFCSKLRAFRTFQQLELHMRREHNLFYCDICVKHLKVFSQQRKCYDRERLAKHRRVGDEDDKSFKGHPLCELCDQRFLDRDELASHCRKEHFHCHFCESDGKLMEFFGDYVLLRNHFESDHYLCEEGECRGVQFTNAFRSEIDLKAHRAQHHRKGMSKAEARQARTLELDIQIAPRSAPAPRTQMRHRHRDRTEQERNRERDRDRDADSDRDRGDPERNSEEAAERKQNYMRKQRREVQSAHARAAILNQIQKQSGSVAVVDKALVENVSLEDAQKEKVAASQFEKKTEDFPSLGLGATSSDINSAEDSDSSQKHSTTASDTLARKVAFAHNFSVQDGSMDDVDFPSLAGRPHVRAAAPPVSRSNPPRGGPSRSAQPRPASSAWAASADESDFPTLPSSRSSHAAFASGGQVRSAWTASNGNSKAPMSKNNTSKNSQSAKQNFTKSLTAGAASGQAAKNKTSRPPSSGAAAAASRYEDFPSLSSIGNTLFGASAPEPAPKLSVYRSSSASVNTNSQEEKAPASAKMRPARFGQEDFPTLGNSGSSGAKNESKAQGKWGGKEAKEEVPSAEKKHKPSTEGKAQLSAPVTLGKNASTQQGSVVSKNNDEKETTKSSDWEPPKAKRTVVEQKQGEELATFVAQQTKNKKKKSKKGKKTKDGSSDPQSAETSDHEPITEETLSDRDSSKTSSQVEANKSSVTVNRLTTDSDSQDAPPAKATLSLAELSKVMSMDAPPLSNDSFPPLSSNSSKSNPPPGFSTSGSSRPPPGFGASSATKPPPPGFKKNEVENIENVNPSSPLVGASSPQYVYIKPPSFKERNQNLIKDVQGMFSESEFDAFKGFSGQFRQSTLTASEYYQQCCDINPQGFAKIFPELLVLLPDIDKQQLLLAAHRNSQDKARGVVKIGNKKSGWNDIGTTPYAVCHVCQQVVSNKDLSLHMKDHNLDADYPMLGS